MQFTISNGTGGLNMFCTACNARLERDTPTGNYECPEEDCGEGGISSPHGIQTSIEDEGRTVRLESTGKPS